MSAGYLRTLKIEKASYEGIGSRYVRGPSNCGRLERAVCKPFNGPDKGQGVRAVEIYVVVVSSKKNSIRRTLIVLAVSA